jgi:hypothetical protein
MKDQFGACIGIEHWDSFVSMLEESGFDLDGWLSKPSCLLDFIRDDIYGDYAVLYLEGGRSSMDIPCWGVEAWCDDHAGDDYSVRYLVDGEFEIRMEDGAVPDSIWTLYTTIEMEVTPSRHATTIPGYENRRRGCRKD